MLRFLMATLIGLSVAGCASLSQESCVAGDWYNIGLRDGANGLRAERHKDHNEACAKYGISVLTEDYTRGRKEGLQAYCTPDNAYQQALYNAYHNDVCPDELKAAFNKAWQAGRRQARMRCLMDYHMALIHHRHYHPHHYYYPGALLGSDCYW